MNAKPKLMRLAVAAVLSLAGAAQAAEMTIFKQPNFSGDALTLRDESANLQGQGFHDQASSIIVRSGRWQVCTQPNFQGDCVIMGRGEYAALDQRLNHRVESAREVTRLADGRDERFRSDRPYVAERGGPLVELFDGLDFSGRRVPVNRDIESLARRGFDEQASSMVIREGVWQVCTRPAYEGRCRVYREGEYADLRNFDNRIGSIKRVG